MRKKSPEKEREGWKTAEVILPNSAEAVSVGLGWVAGSDSRRRGKTKKRTLHMARVREGKEKE